MTRGYFAIGIENGKDKQNIGTLWRSAHVFGAAFIFVIGRRYEKQAGDTTKAWRSIPLFHYATFDQFYNHMPRDCQLVGIELTDHATPINHVTHYERTIYLLGAEDHGLSCQAKAKVTQTIILPGKYCLNVAVAGSIVMFDRIQKQND